MALQELPDTDNIELTLSQIRDKYIDNIILVGIAFGFVSSILTIYRDAELEISINSVANVIMVLIISFVWIFRKHVKTQIKIGILVLVFSVVAIKSLIIMGPFGVSIIWFLFILISVVISLNIRQTIIIGLITLIPLSVVAWMYTQRELQLPNGFVNFSNNTYFWLNFIFMYLLVSSVIISGTYFLKTNVLGLLERVRNKNQVLDQEIKKRVETNNALKISNFQLRTLLDSSRDCVILLDQEGKFLDANIAWENLSGFQLNQLKEMNIFNFVLPEFQRQVQKTYAKVLEGEGDAAFSQLKIKNDKGEIIPIEVSSNLILSEDDIHVMSTIRDITFRNEVERRKFSIALEAEERERHRLAQDLHDELGPVFSTVQLYLDAMGEQEKDQKNKQNIDKIASIINGAVKQVRSISHNLQPPILSSKGLFRSLEIYLNDLRESGKIDTEYSLDQFNKVELDNQVTVVLYRTILELVNNTLKHAGASKIKLYIVQTENLLSINYSDNGKGFDLEEVKLGLGINNIINRIQALNGSIEFKREDAMTTIITIGI